MLIDSHAHLNFDAYKKDRKEVVARTLKEGIWIVNVGAQYQTSERAVRIAQQYELGVYATVGLHPLYPSAEFVKLKTDPWEGDLGAPELSLGKTRYKALAQSSKVVAIGEIGLDYYYRPKTTQKLQLFKQRQRRIFLEQLEIAKILDLPVILHCRMAHEEMIKELGDFKKKNTNLRGVIHSFTGTVEQARQYLSLGFYIGFNGIIFKLDLDEAIKKIPLEKILVETDCPYLIPPSASHNHQKDVVARGDRNEPIFVKLIAERIAHLKNVSFETVARMTTQNTRNLLRI